MIRQALFFLAVTAGLFAVAYAAGVAHGNPNTRVRRYGSVIMVKPEMFDTYKRLHANAWPGVLNKIHDCNIRNYSIYFKETEHGKYYLFSYFEYAGADFEADMKKMADDPVTQQWWKETDPCQMKIPNAGAGEWWADMEEVFHCD